MEKCGEVIVKFDLSRPLDIQWERAKFILEGTKAYLEENGKISIFEPRNHVKKYPFYLRVLDAEEEGVGLDKIAATLIPNEENTSNSWSETEKSQYAHRWWKNVQNPHFCNPL